MGNRTEVTNLTMKLNMPAMPGRHSAVAGLRVAGAHVSRPGSHHFSLEYGLSWRTNRKLGHFAS